MTLLLAAFSYINNLVLLPRFIAQKKINLYVPVFGLLIIFFSIINTFAIKMILEAYPKITVSQISFIGASVSPTWSLIVIVKEALRSIDTYFFWGLIFTMAWYMITYIRQEKVIEETKKKQIETELSFLKSQINPHFLFNNLNNLYALSIKKSERTPEVILKLSSLLRYLLYESNVEEISFNKEKEIMQAYIDLELLRLPAIPNIQISINSDKQYNIPPLLWLPILENIFKHGTRFISEDYYIDYRFIIDDGRITIYSKNYFKKTAGTKNGNVHIGGIGLTNLKKRLDLLYPEKYVITNNIENSYYIVEAKINI